MGNGEKRSENLTMLYTCCVKGLVARRGERTTSNRSFDGSPRSVCEIISRAIRACQEIRPNQGRPRTRSKVDRRLYSKPERGLNQSLDSSRYALRGSRNRVTAYGVY